MDIASVLLVVILYVVFAVVLLYLVFGGFIYGAMWMPLPAHRVKRMLELSDLSFGKWVYDLGSGFGNVAFKASLFPVNVVAVEADPFKAWWVRRQIRKKKLSHVSLVQANLLNIDLSEADVLLCYLSDSLMDKIAQKQLKENAVIISACHKIKGRKPKFIDRDGIYPIYVY